VILVDEAEITFESGDYEYAILIDRHQWEHTLRAYKALDFQHGRYDQNYKILDYNYEWTTSGWLVQSNSYLQEILENFTLEILQHGLMTYFVSLYSFLDVKPPENGPQILTLYMLSAGFYVWLGTIYVACIVFVCEHCCKNLKITKENL
jgi:hypothetical protein